MTENMKISLFEKMLEFEHEAENGGAIAFEQMQGAYKMLVAVGLEKEYVEWSNGK